MRRIVCLAAALALVGVARADGQADLQKVIDKAIKATGAAAAAGPATSPNARATSPKPGEDRCAIGGLTAKRARAARRAGGTVSIRHAGGGGQQRPAIS